MPEPLTSENVVLTNSVYKALTTACYNIASSVAAVGRGQQSTYVLLTLEGDQARFKINGSAPAAACGHTWIAGDIITLDSVGAIRNFKAILSAAGTATIVATYFY